jgi:hypothetical protein
MRRALLIAAGVAIVLIAVSFLIWPSGTFPVHIGGDGQHAGVPLRIRQGA